MIETGAHVEIVGTENDSIDLNESLEGIQNSDNKTLVFVFGANNFFKTTEEGKKCTTLLSDANFKLTKKCNLRFVLIDTMSGLKDVCSYSAFSNCINKSNCLWLCAGLGSNLGFVDTGSTFLNKLPKLQANQGYFIKDTSVSVVQLVEKGA